METQKRGKMEKKRKTVREKVRVKKREREREREREKTSTHRIVLIEAIGAHLHSIISNVNFASSKSSKAVCVRLLYGR